MSRQRYSLPEERPLVVTDHDGRRSGVWLFGCLLIPPAAGYLWRGATYGDWGWGAVGLIISIGFAWFVSDGLSTRCAEGSRRVYSRFQQPMRYWFAMLAWSAAYLLSVAAFFLAHGSTGGAMHR